MAHIITTTPQNLRVFLGVPDTAAVGWVFEGIAENLSRETIFERRSPTMSAAIESAFRHPPGEKWTVWVPYGDDSAIWLWATGRAEVHIESGTGNT